MTPQSHRSKRSMSSPARRARACLAFVVALVFYAVPGTSDALAQKPLGLQWADCGDGFECATATVPLDYARPQAGTLDIAVTRMPAKEPDRRLGSLLVNFGGPGDPAAQTLRGDETATFASLNDRYDIVAFDPRGTSGADAIDCKNGNAEEVGPQAQPFPHPETVDPRALVATYRSYIDRCVALNPRVLPYVSTANVARDMDAIRRALGERTVDYVGFSYGTLLGATFETLFPHSVGRFVLDGAVDDSWLTDPIQFTREQLKGFEVALDRFFEACAANQDACSGFGGASPEAAFDELVEQLNVAPIPAGGGDPRTVDGDDVLAAAGFALYSKQIWWLLGQALALTASGEGSLMRALTDASYRRLEDGSYDPLFDRFRAIASLERLYPRELGLYLRIGAQDHELFEHFGWSGGYSALLNGLWPVRPKGVYRGPFRVPAFAPTTLVIGTTYDPATPYKSAQRLTRQLGNARLLTMQGDGHTAYGANSPCINAAVDAYLEDGTVPAAGTVCEQAVPFERPTPAARSRDRTWALVERIRTHMRP